MPEGRKELADAANALSARVDELGHHLTISQGQIDKMRRLTRITTALTVVGSVIVLVMVFLWFGIKDAAEDNKATQVQSCQNANESREASRLLWNFVIDISIASNDPEATPPKEQEEERQLLEQIRGWVNELYQIRDCSDLTKEYDLPPPPEILEQLRELSNQSQ